MDNMPGVLGKGGKEGRIFPRKEVSGFIDELTGQGLQRMISPVE